MDKIRIWRVKTINKPEKYLIFDYNNLRMILFGSKMGINDMMNYVKIHLDNHDLVLDGIIDRAIMDDLATYVVPAKDKRYNIFAILEARYARKRFERNQHSLSAEQFLAAYLSLRPESEKRKGVLYTKEEVQESQRYAYWV